MTPTVLVEVDLDVSALEERVVAQADGLNSREKSQPRV